MDQLGRDYKFFLHQHRDQAKYFSPTDMSLYTDDVKMVFSEHVIGINKKIESFGGKGEYERILRTLRWSISTWSSWKLMTHPEMKVSRIWVQEHDNDERRIAVHWKVTVHQNRSENSKEDVMTGYSYYYLDFKSGKIKLHVIDRIVPPIVGGWPLLLFMKSISRYQAVLSSIGFI